MNGDVGAIFPDAEWQKFSKRVVVDQETGCWLWQGPKLPTGYGTFRAGDGTQVYAHRYSYERVHGAIPSDLEVHHNECSTRSCTNPFHMEAMTHAAHQAVHRGTYCRSGKHLMTGENLIIRAVPGRAPLRRCRQCSREGSLAYYDRRRNESKGSGRRQV